jgi:Flp pilus assembly protein TadB
MGMPRIFMWLCCAGLALAMVGLVVGSSRLFTFGTVFACIMLAFAVWRHRGKTDDDSKGFKNGGRA